MSDPTPAAQIAPDGREVIYTAIRAYIDGNPFFLNTVEREANAIYDAIHAAGLAIVPAADPDPEKVRVGRTVLMDALAVCDMHGMNGVAKRLRAALQQREGGNG